MEFSKKPINKFYIFSIYSFAILFLILYFILSLNSRIAGDDYFYLWLKNTFGAWDGMIYQYNQWSGRWASHWIGCAMISHWRNPFFLPIVNFFTLGVLYFSLKIGFEKITAQLKIKIDTIIIPPLIILLITTFFFTSFSIGETWFWYIIILTYLWSIIAFIFLLNLIFSFKNNFQTILFIIICSAYIGGASESFALIFLFSLSVILLYRKKLNMIRSFLSIDQKLILAISVLLLSFSFSYFAPGTEIRNSLLPHTPLLEKLQIFSKSYIKYFLRYLPDKIIYLLLFSIPWLYFGSHYLKNTFKENEVLKIIKNLTLLFLVLLAITLLPTSFIMSETGPGRSLSIVSLLTVIYYSLLFSLLGIFIDTNKILNRILFTSLSLISILFLIFTIYFQYGITKHFSQACDERLQSLDAALKNNLKGTLELNKIPPEGMLFWDELSEDTTYFTNKHLKDGLNLPFQVKLKLK